MKVLILSIFNETDYYKKMKNIQMKYVNNNEHIDYYFITFKTFMSKNVEIINNIIYVKGVETAMNILEKTIVALDYLINIKKNTYDYIIRTNISTIFNYTLLIQYLHSIPQNDIYIGGIFFKLAWLDYKYGINDYKIDLYSLQNLYYFQGTGITMSFDVVQCILQNKINLKYDIIDDVAIGLFIKNYIPKAYSRMLEIPHMKYSKNCFTNEAVIIRNRLGDIGAIGGDITEEYIINNMDQIVTNHILVDKLENDSDS